MQSTRILQGIGVVVLVLGLAGQASADVKAKQVVAALDGSQVGKLVTVSDATVVAAASAGKLALNPNGGNVGIGTSNATAALTVQRRPGTALVARFQDNSNPHSAVDIRATSLRGEVQGISNGNPGTLALNPDGGNVGIGTDSPIVRLHVSGGDIRADRGELDASLTRSLILGGARDIGKQPYATIQFQNYDTSSGAADYIGAKISSKNGFDDEAGDLGFYTKAPGSTGQLLKRVTITPRGRVGIGITDVSYPLEMASGAHVTEGGTWTNASSRAKKENFQATGTRDVLQRVLSLPISSWNYKIEDDGVRHIGPMAEDFFAAFGLGDAADSIATVDSDGVALAAIQGLHDLMLEKDGRIAEQQSRIANLEERLQRIEALISHE